MVAIKKRLKLRGARRNDGLFKQEKSRVGQPKRLAANATRADCKTKLVRIGQQRNVTNAAKGRFVTSKNLTIDELISQAASPNVNCKRNALAGIVEVLEKFPHVFVARTGQLLLTLARYASDDDAKVRKLQRDAMHRLLRALIRQDRQDQSTATSFSSDEALEMSQSEQVKVDARVLLPFADRLGLLIRSCMTHRNADVRADVVRTLEILKSLPSSAEYLLPKVFLSATDNVTSDILTGACNFLRSLLTKCNYSDMRDPDSRITQTLALSKLTTSILVTTTRRLNGNIAEGVDPSTGRVIQAPLRQVLGSERLFADALSVSFLSSSLLGGSRAKTEPLSDTNLSTNMSASHSTTRVVSAQSLREEEILALMNTLAELYFRLSYNIDGDTSRSHSSSLQRKRNRFSFGATKHAKDLETGHKRSSEPSWNSTGKRRDDHESMKESVKKQVRLLLNSLGFSEYRMESSASAVQALIAATQVELLSSIYCLMTQLKTDAASAEESTTAQKTAALMLQKRVFPGDFLDATEHPKAPDPASSSAHKKSPMSVLCHKQAQLITTLELLSKTAK